MKRLVILGEGHGEVSALPILANRILQEKDTERQLFVDDAIIRAHNPSGLVKSNKESNSRNSRSGSNALGLLPTGQIWGAYWRGFDGDAKKFPAGAASLFCATKAAKSMAEAATKIGAGKSLLIAVVFANVEYESWIIAGTESLAGKSFEDGRPILPANMAFPEGDPESHGKRWLERNCLTGYRPRRDQCPLKTKLVDLQAVRSKRLRSFSRLDHAIEQVLDAVGRNVCIVTP